MLFISFQIFLSGVNIDIPCATKFHEFHASTSTRSKSNLRLKIFLLPLLWGIINTSRGNKNKIPYIFNLSTRRMRAVSFFSGSLPQGRSFVVSSLCNLWKEQHCLILRKMFTERENRQRGEIVVNSRQHVGTLLLVLRLEQDISF